MNNKKIEDKTIETWELDLSEIAWCVHNRKPSKVIKRIKGIEYIPGEIDMFEFVQTLLQDREREAVEKTIEKYKEWVLPNLTEQDKKWMEEDSINVLADVMGWCVICNKANGKLTEEGICGDCL